MTFSHLLFILRLNCHNFVQRRRWFGMCIRSFVVEGLLYRYFVHTAYVQQESFYGVVVSFPKNWINQSIYDWVHWKFCWVRISNSIVHNTQISVLYLTAISMSHVIAIGLFLNMTLWYTCVVEKQEPVKSDENLARNRLRLCDKSEHPWEVIILIITGLIRVGFYKNWRNARLSDTHPEGW